jgi:hypothetical protein
MGTSSRPDIKATCEPLGETRPKCIPAKWPDPGAVLTVHMRRIKCRVIHKWARVTLKREGSIRKWEVEVIAPARPDNNSKARRKSQANADAAGSPLEAPFQTATVTRRKVAGMEVAA